VIRIDLGVSQTSSLSPPDLLSIPDMAQMISLAVFLVDRMRVVVTVSQLTIRIKSRWLKR